ADGQLPAFSAEHEAALDGFAECYADHLRHEDDSIYPAARALLVIDAQQSMGREMAVRRGVR
ncbi:MAG: hemerythrin domain-containing protein, partial [Burkholderiales bacterium]|nr:hemerythrin domain-containing protein [Burkholderiales bacterium]